jgi:hypothetical protein
MNIMLTHIFGRYLEEKIWIQYVDSNYIIDVCDHYTQQRQNADLKFFC